MHQSLTRDGNHFIRLGEDFHALYRDKWFLIDGSWFEYLERIYSNNNQDEIVLRPYHKMSMVPIDGHCPTIPTDHPEFIFWERKSIPYYRASKGIERNLYNVDQLRHYASLVEKYHNVHINTLDLILTKYSSIPAWQCNHGVLPAWLKNENWDEHLEELFELLTTPTISLQRGRHYNANRG